MRGALAPGADPVAARRTALARALVVALLVSLAGCAARPVAAPPVPRPAPPAERPASGTQFGTTVSGGSITSHQAPVPAVIDSTPSADALAVLGTIAEPLGANGSPDTVGVPVPAPTQPLGDRPGTHAIAALPESVAAPGLPPPTVSSPGSSHGAATGAATARADSCWRVQVAAPPERERAERMAEVARSQLLLPFVIEREGGLFKVRVRECLSAGAANDLRRRAVESGFAGAFRFPGRAR